MFCLAARKESFVEGNFFTRFESSLSPGQEKGEREKKLLLLKREGFYNVTQDTNDCSNLEENVKLPS